MTTRQIAVLAFALTPWIGLAGTHLVHRLGGVFDRPGMRTGFMWGYFLGALIASLLVLLIEGFVRRDRIKKDGLEKPSRP